MIYDLLQKPHDHSNYIVPIVTIPQTFKSTKTTPILHNLNFVILLILALNLVLYLFVSQCFHSFISILTHLHEYLIVYLSFVNFVIFNKNKKLQNFVKNAYEFYGLWISNKYLHILKNERIIRSLNKLN